MSLTEILLLIIVVAGAAYAGYLFGRQSALAERRGGRAADDEPTSLPGPLPGPREGYDGPRRSSTPPPASAGGDTDVPAAPRPRSAAPPPASAGGGETGSGHSGVQPRRTAAPPPARAGLMDTGGDKPKKR